VQGGPSNEEPLVAAAVEHRSHSTPPEPGPGDLRDDLLTVVRWLARQIAEQEVGLLGALFTGMRSDPRLAAEMRRILRRDEAATTGATGALNGATVEHLLERVPAEQVGVSVRDVARAQHFADRGVRVRAGSYEDPAALRHSSNDPQADAVGLHRVGIEAAVAAGAQRILYTSHQGAGPDNPFHPARDHAATERLLADSGVAWTLLRNGFYAHSLGWLLQDVPDVDPGPLCSTRGVEPHPGFGSPQGADMARDPAAWREDSHEVGNALVDVAPPGWRRIDLLCRVVEDVFDLTLTVVMADGDHTAVPLPEQVPALVERMREAWRQPKDGTWSSMRYMLTAPTAIQLIYLAERPVEPVDQHGYWIKIATIIAFAVPPDWAEVALVYRSDVTVTVQRVSDGGWYEWTPPAEVAELLTGLREATRNPSRGRWRSVEARIHLDMSSDYTYHWEPVVPTFAGEVDPAEPLASARRALTDLGVPPDRYRIDGTADEAWCLIRESSGWKGPDDYFWMVCRGTERRQQSTFPTEVEAARFFVAQVYRSHASFWGDLRPDARRDTKDWPIQPTGGDVGLQMYGGKRLVVLAPSTELDRYGDPKGNTLYAAGTEFPNRSEPAEIETWEFHVYRLRKPVRAITGVVIPWYDQPGDGVAYVLEHPVADYLAVDAIEELGSADSVG
jgi:hypothetical protein